MGLSVLALMRGNNGPWKYVNPGLRMYVDLTPFVRSKSGRRTLLRMLPLADGRSAAVFPALLEDPRFSIVRTSPRKGHGRRKRAGTALRAPRRQNDRARTGPRTSAMTAQLIPAVLRALLWPDAELRRARRYQTRLEARLALPLPASPARRLQHAEDVLGTTVSGLIQATLPGPAAGYLMLAAARRLLRGIAKPRELEAVLRGLPHNVTTIMDLELWHLAVSLGRDPEARRLLTEQRPEELAARYDAGSLPAVAQAGLRKFLSKYGHRAVAEIDLGMPRWSEEPDHLLGMISNYLRVEDPGQAPDRQFAKAADDAEARISELVDACRGQKPAAGRGWWRSACGGPGSWPACGNFRSSAS